MAERAWCSSRSTFLRFALFWIYRLSLPVESFGERMLFTNLWTGNRPGMKRMLTSISTSPNFNDLGFMFQSSALEKRKEQVVTDVLTKNRCDCAVTSGSGKHSSASGSSKSAWCLVSVASKNYKICDAYLFRKMVSEDGIGPSAADNRCISDKCAPWTHRGSAPSLRGVQSPRASTPSSPGGRPLASHPAAHPRPTRSSLSTHASPPRSPP
eukprot:683854_1